ncbi:hypothetical protein K3495_g1910 [Podosphaera aphanis]|nr:hypothetical protein K3495_g1910 [Podosphaera aphanis]
MSVYDSVSTGISSSYHVEDLSCDELAEGVSLTHETSSGRHAPPNTPSSDYSRSPQPSQQSHVNLSLVHVIDLRAVSYEGAVDENLICAICRCILVDPISTTCQHTFCSECLENALTHSSTCPIDRSALSKEMDVIPAPKIIQNQLDGLKVLCPCCSASVARSMIATHMSRYCQESLIRCPGINTEKKCALRIPRKLAEQGCLHYSTCCPDCEETLIRIDLPKHREAACQARYVECRECGCQILRMRESEHSSECPETMIDCRWKEYGCEQKSRRRELATHLDSCGFQLVGRVADTLKKDIHDLRDKVETLTKTNQLQERRIKFLEYGTQHVDRPVQLDDPASPHLATIASAAPLEPPNSGHEYLMSLLEFQENKLSQLSTSMTDLEVKQTTMLFNETIPIKNELAEMRSLQQTANIHIRWLMAFRLHENSKRVGHGAGSVHTDDGMTEAGPSGETPCLRRPLNSTSRDIITKL